MSIVDEVVGSVTENFSSFPPASFGERTGAPCVVKIQ
jgi:hypothetical protein